MICAKAKLNPALKGISLDGDEELAGLFEEFTLTDEPILPTGFTLERLNHHLRTGCPGTEEGG